MLMLVSPYELGVGHNILVYQIRLYISSAFLAIGNGEACLQDCRKFLKRSMLPTQTDGSRLGEMRCLAQFGTWSDLCRQYHAIYVDFPCHFELKSETSRGQ